MRIAPPHAEDAQDALAMRGAGIAPELQAAARKVLDAHLADAAEKLLTHSLPGRRRNGSRKLDPEAYLRADGDVHGSLAAVGEVEQGRYI